MSIATYFTEAKTFHHLEETPTHRLEETKTYPMFRIQKVVNAILGALLTYACFPVAPMAANLTLKLPLKILGLAMGISALFGLFVPDARPALAYVNEHSDRVAKQA